VDAGTAVILGAAIGGVTGLAGTLAAGYLQRRATGRAQRQAWRAEVYVAALTALNRERLIIARTLPLIGPVPAPPPPATDDVAVLIQAQLSAHSSTAMRGLLDRWSEARRRFEALGWELNDVTEAMRSWGVTAREASGGRTRGEIYQDIVSVRTELIGTAAEHGILAAIEAEARKELGHRD
jgi:hypothetical protein